jgi:hypothetical protein
MEYDSGLTTIELKDKQSRIKSIVESSVAIEKSNAVEHPNASSAANDQNRLAVFSDADADTAISERHANQRNRDRAYLKQDIEDADLFDTVSMSAVQKLISEMEEVGIEHLLCYEINLPDVLALEK